MVTANPVSSGPLVSVIVPARNEEVSLGACLESLVAQGGVSREIIVVDDGSTDRTRQIAESFAGVRVIPAPPLPPSWTGKNNAIAAGVREARGEWLLFTDADTIHYPGSLVRGLNEARQKSVAMLSYSPEQEVHGFWEKAVMPVIFAELATTYRPSEVSDPYSPVAAANGQYILIKREAYDAVGGHAAIATDLLEDVTLARNVKFSGRRVFFRYGGDAVRTRMYRNFAQLREGWSKNLALLFPASLELSLWRLLECMFLWGALAGTVTLELVRPRIGFVLIFVFFAAYASFMTRIRKAHFPPDADALAIFGLPVFVYLLLRSRLFYKRGRVQWKGRTYTGNLANQS